MFSLRRIAEIIDACEWSTLIKHQTEIIHSLTVISTHLTQRRCKDARGATIQEVLSVCPDGFIVDHNGLIYRGGLFDSGVAVNPDEIKRVMA